MISSDGWCKSKFLAKKKNSDISVGANFQDGADDQNRTDMGYPTRPSNVRVYQFRHVRN